MDVPEQGDPPGSPDCLETVEQASPKPASSGSKKDPNALDHETSAHAGLASSVPSFESEGTSDSEDFSAPSPPLTKGRKTNKERRENEAASNISSGS